MPAVDAGPQADWKGREEVPVSGSADLPPAVSGEVLDRQIIERNDFRLGRDNA